MPQTSVSLFRVYTHRNCFAPLHSNVFCCISCLLGLLIHTIWKLQYPWQTCIICGCKTPVATILHWGLQWSYKTVTLICCTCINWSLSFSKWSYWLSQTSLQYDLSLFQNWVHCFSLQDSSANVPTCIAKFSSSFPFLCLPSLWCFKEKVLML